MKLSSGWIIPILNNPEKNFRPGPVANKIKQPARPGKEETMDRQSEISNLEKQMAELQYKLDKLKNSPKYYTSSGSTFSHIYSPMGLLTNDEICTLLNREDSECACGADIETGTHNAQVPVPAPGHLNFGKAYISIDACLVREVWDLWYKYNITTTGCCCGHNEQEGYIGVIASDIPKMKSLGYTVHQNPMRPGDEDSFIPLSVPRRRYGQAVVDRVVSNFNAKFADVLPSTSQLVLFLTSEINRIAGIVEGADKCLSAVERINGDRHMIGICHHNKQSEIKADAN